MRLPIRLTGPAPAWPRPLDAGLEWWAALPVRARIALRAGLAVVVVAAVTGGIVQGPWGPPVAVLVTARDVAAGAPLGPADVRVAERPADLLADDALRAPDELGPGSLAAGHLPAGTVVTRRAVGDGPAAAAPAGTAVLPVPADALPALPIGTRVDVAVAGLDGSATIVARGATVVADDGIWRWLRVERDAVADVARGVTDGALVVAVLPPLPTDGP